jgi:hypothetical protein
LLAENYDSRNSKSVDIDFYRRNFEKPQLITNLNNLNYQNFNTINESSAKDILYELKQYERFADSNQIHFNSCVDRRNSYSKGYNGSNFSQNILNYNNSFYKINNINNFHVKHKSSPSQIESENPFYRQPNENLLNDNMESRNEIVECSQLVNKNRDADGKRTTIHNFSSNNIISHANMTQNNFDEDEENANNNHNPLHSHHFTQVKEFFHSA